MATKVTDPKPRYDRLAEALLASDNPTKAIAQLLGDHEGRLDALAARLHHVECQAEHDKTKRGHMTWDEYPMSGV